MNYFNNFTICDFIHNLTISIYKYIFGLLDGIKPNIYLYILAHITTN